MGLFETKDTTSSEAELREKIIELGPWFHQIEITPSLRTRDIAPSPGPQPPDHPRSRWTVIKDFIPDDLSGQRILDIGCADGFFSLELAKRGAEVVAIDAAPKMIDRLNWVIKEKKIKNITASVGLIEDLDDSDQYDAIFFIALLYHLKSPLVGLEKLAALSDKIYLETTVHEMDGPYLYLEPAKPGVHAIPKWFPTRECVEDMLKFAGFSNIQALPDATVNRAIYLATK